LTIAGIFTATHGIAADFSFARGQRVYVVAVDGRSRDSLVTNPDLREERRIRDQFTKQKSFVIVRTLHEADFVFFEMINSDHQLGGSQEAIAVALSPSDYERANGNLDAIRNAASWQSDGHYGHTGLVVATMGTSAIFDHADTALVLVKKFHKETLGK
jgi:hypothetical protein